MLGVRNSGHFGEKGLWVWALLTPTAGAIAKKWIQLYTIDGERRDWPGGGGRLKNAKPVEYAKDWLLD